MQKISPKELASKQTGEKFSLSSILSDALELEHLFVHKEIIAPGRSTSSPHSHTKNEELIIVLEGNPTAHFGKKQKQLRPNDIIAFKPSDHILHYIVNHDKQAATIIVVSSNLADDQVIYHNS